MSNDIVFLAIFSLLLINLFLQGENLRLALQNRRILFDLILGGNPNEKMLSRTCFPLLVCSTWRDILLNSVHHSSGSRKLQFIRDFLRVGVH
jgi:hypothetical protein